MTQVSQFLAASNKGQVFSELISCFENQIFISKSKGEKEKTKTKPSYGQGFFKIFMFDDYPIETEGELQKKHI